MSELDSLTSLDGRYAADAEPLRAHFSEFAFLRDRVHVELAYLAALSAAGLVRDLTDLEFTRLEALRAEFSGADAELIREHEGRTRHDVKAIEYFLGEKLKGDSLEDLVPWVHFGLTSEDVNSLAQANALREARETVMLPALDDLVESLRAFARQNRAVVMLARTHGQFAVPTTLGKEIAVYIVRLQKVRAALAGHRFEAKLTGAVGNFNALRAAASHVNWLAFSRDFVGRFSLDANLHTTQILPYDNWVRYFDLLRLANGILIDFAQDIWRYISDGYLKQAVVEGEVGSSTMPQKVNPIDFENAEGNLGVANALFMHYAQKLTASRLQRDLSDSTVRRTFGSAHGHTLVAWLNLQRGMARVAADEDKLRADLNAHWEVVAEGAQTILRAAGRADAYESLKDRTRGRVLTESDYRSWLESVEVDADTRVLLQNLSPEAYTGLAVELTDEVTG